MPIALLFSVYLSLPLYLQSFSMNNALSFSSAHSSRPFTSLSFANVSIFFQPPSTDDFVFTPTFKTLRYVFVYFAFHILTSFVYFPFTYPFYPLVFSIDKVHCTMRYLQLICASFEGGLKSNLVRVLIEGENDNCI